MDALYASRWSRSARVRSHWEAALGLLLARAQGGAPCAGDADSREGQVWTPSPSGHHPEPKRGVSRSD